jgi:rhodanese-related sulfurtransferase
MLHYTYAVNSSSTSALNMQTHLSPQAAWDLLQQDPRATLIDIRSSMEFLFVGHPRGSVHVPWIDEPNWEVNPDFVGAVRKELAVRGRTPTDPVILICRSGKRSLEAGTALRTHGFTAVSHIDEGFEGELDEAHHRSTVGGWRFRGLPWEQC